MHSIVLVDDHGIVREGFKRMIMEEPDLQVIGEAADVSGALGLLQDAAPEILVLDLSLPGGGGLALLEQLADFGNPVAVVVMSMHDTSAYVAEAMAKGASAYVSKAAAADELLPAIRAVLSGIRYISSDLDRRGNSGALRLTPRELEVLHALSLGMVAKQAAVALGVSLKTIYAHRASAMQKLDARNDYDLLVKAADYVSLRGRY